MISKKTLVIGASTNPDRYSYLAITRLLKYQHPVVAIGSKPGQIGPVTIETTTRPFDHIDTVTLYLNPQRQQPYYNYLIALQPKRIIFNPGTENEALAALAQQNGIEVLEACTLVLLGTGQY